MSSQQQAVGTLPSRILRSIDARQWSPPRAVFQTEGRFKGVSYAAVGVVAAALGIGTLFLVNALDWRMRSLRVIAVLVILGGVVWAIYSVAHATLRRTRTISAHVEGLICDDGKTVQAIGWDEVVELRTFDLTMFNETRPAMFHLIASNGSLIKADGDIKGFQDLSRLAEEESARRRRQITRQPIKRSGKWAAQGASSNASSDRPNGLSGPRATEETPSAHHHFGHPGRSKTRISARWYLLPAAVLVATAGGIWIIWWLLEVVEVELPGTINALMPFIPSVILVGGALLAVTLAVGIFVQRRREHPHE